MRISREARERGYGYVATWNYFVTHQLDSRTRFILGPYPSMEAAEDQIPQAIVLAQRADPWAIFGTMGIARAPKDMEVKTEFGAGEPSHRSHGTPGK